MNNILVPWDGKNIPIEDTIENSKIMELLLDGDKSLLINGIYYKLNPLITSNLEYVFSEKRKMSNLGVINNLLKTY